MSFNHSNLESRPSTSLVERASVFSLDLLDKQLNRKYIFHNQRYTAQTVHAIHLISEAEELPTEQKMELEIAAWFHHTGLIQTDSNHREVSAAIAREFLTRSQLAEESIGRITDTIVQSGSPWDVTSLMDMILYDADWYFLAASNFGEMLDRKKEELILRNGDLKALQWLDFMEDAFVRHQYLTNYGKDRLHNLRRINYISIKNQPDQVWPKSRKVYELQSSF